MPSQDYVFCSPFFFSALKKNVKTCKDTYDSIGTFVHKKFKLTLIGQTLIVPVCDTGHWNLAVMTWNTLYHFDSMHHNHIHGRTEFYRLLEKVWCVRFGFDQRSREWKRATDRCTWQVVRVPQQRGNWKCAYFTMK